MIRTLPPRLDIFALIILIGIVQGIFLGLFFLTGSRRQDIGNRCLGWMLLAISLLITEIFLNHSHYMFQVLELVDFSEPTNLVAGPLFYLFIVARTRHKLPNYWWLHLIPFVIWTLNSVTWLYQPLIFKYNSYIDSYHPELPFIVPCPSYLPEDLTGLRDKINEMTLLSLSVYVILSFIEIRKSFRLVAKPFLGTTPVSLTRLRNLTFSLALLPLLIILVKPNYYHDLGDYILACYVTMTIYSTSFLVMSGSDFFKTTPPVEREVVIEPKKKYEKSSLSEELEENLLARLTRLLSDEKPFLESDLTLPKLAQRLNTSPHHLSQLLNDRLQQSFFDMLAQYRIQEACQLLHDPGTAHLKIDEIAERVGYNSTSAFHTAFKRLTRQTPAQFRAAATRE